MSGRGNLTPFVRWDWCLPVAIGSCQTVFFGRRWGDFCMAMSKVKRKYYKEDVQYRLCSFWLDRDDEADFFQIGGLWNNIFLYSSRTLGGCVCPNFYSFLWGVDQKYVESDSAAWLCQDITQGLNIFDLLVWGESQEMGFTWRSNSIVQNYWPVGHLMIFLLFCIYIFFFWGGGARQQCCRNMFRWRRRPMLMLSWSPSAPSLRGGVDPDAAPARGFQFCGVPWALLLNCFNKFKPSNLTPWEC